MAKHIQRKDGEGFTVPNKRIFRLSCCDCGLTHDFAIFVDGKRAGSAVGIAAKRNNRATSAKRRYLESALSGEGK